MIWSFKINLFCIFYFIRVGRVYFLLFIEKIDSYINDF